MTRSNPMTTCEPGVFCPVTRAVQALGGKWKLHIVLGPFNYLGSCGTLKERDRYERRNEGLPWLNWRLVGETVCKIAVGDGDANLKEQVCPSFRPTHLLLLDHPHCDQVVHARFSGRGSDPLPFAISCAVIGNRTPVLLNVDAQVQQTAV